MSNGPRLPALHVDGFEAPETQPTAGERVDQQLELDKDREIYTVSLPVGGITGAGSVPKENRVYKTFAPWHALDVYAKVNLVGGLASNGLLSVFVYALVKGSRTLVASGRQFLLGGTPQALVVPTIWIAGVRGVAQRFEVTYLVTQLTNAPLLRGTIDFAVAAANDDTEVPDDVGNEQAGACYLVGAPALGSSADPIGDPTGSFAQLAPALELVQVRGVNSAAAARYLQLHDKTTAAVNGDQPVIEWPMGALAGSGVVDSTVRYRAKNRIQLWVSSTPAGLTKVVVAEAITGVMR